jgi:hypothetical protein
MRFTDFGADPNQPMPPADPLKGLDPKKARDVVNALWKTYLEGEKILKAAEGWHTILETLQPCMTPILEWLRNFTGSSLHGRRTDPKRQND